VDTFSVGWDFFFGTTVICPVVTAAVEEIVVLTLIQALFDELNYVLQNLVGTRVVVHAFATQNPSVSAVIF